MMLIGDLACLVIACFSVLFTAWHCGVYLGDQASHYIHRRCKRVDSEDNSTDRTDEQ
jgi:hypothetical protein